MMRRKGKGAHSIRKNTTENHICVYILAMIVTVCHIVSGIFHFSYYCRVIFFSAHIFVVVVLYVVITHSQFVLFRHFSFNPVSLCVSVYGTRYAQLSHVCVVAYFILF